MTYFQDSLMYGNSMNILMAKGKNRKIVGRPRSTARLKLKASIESYSCIFNPGGTLLQ